MRAIKFVSIIVLVTGGLPTGSSPALASFHDVAIVEVFAGTPEHPNAQYVELQMASAGQNFVKDQKIEFFDASGGKTGEAIFTANLGSGVAQSSILVATTEAEVFFGIEADLTMPALLSSSGGAVGYAQGTDIVSWATFPSSVHNDGEVFAFSTSFLGTGIIPGAAIGRDTSRGSNRNGLDGGDDTDNSTADFSYIVPSPRNNAGTVGQAPGGIVCITTPCFSLRDDPDHVVSDGGQVELNVCVERGVGAIGVTASTADGRATAPDDYTSQARDLALGDVKCSSLSVPTTGSGTAEPAEIFFVTLSNPTGGAVLGPPIATIKIEGETGDQPATTITKPKHGMTYDADALTTFSGTMETHFSGTELALRKKMKNGSCKWLVEDDQGNQLFISGACRTIRFGIIAITGADDWEATLARRLTPSVGTRTKVKNYMLISHAIGEGMSDVVPSRSGLDVDYAGG